MKICKKLLAVLLSVLLLVSVVFIPTTAETTIESSATETVTKYISLMDLSEVKVGATTTGDATALPDTAAMNAAGISRAQVYGAAHNGTKFSGTQEIIEVGDKKAWKINFDVVQSSGSDLHNFQNLFFVKFAVPTHYAPHITGINADLTNGTALKLGYYFGVTDDTTFVNNNTNTANYGKNNSGIVTVGKGTTEGEAVKVEAPLSSLYKNTSYANFNKGTTGTNFWATGDDITYVYIVLTDRAATGTEGGYAIINDIGINVTMPKDVYDNIEHTYTIDLFDFEKLPIGVMNDYPDGVTAYKDNYLTNGGTREIVKLSDGKKGMSIDLSSVTWGGDAKSTNKLYGDNNTKDFDPWFGISAKIPTGYIPYIDSINIGVHKNTESLLCYTYGVKDSDNISKTGPNDYSFDAAVSGRQALSVAPNSIYKISSSRFGKSCIYGGVDYRTTLWNADYSDMYFVFAASAGAEGTVVIDEFSITVSMTNVQYDAMVVTKNVNLLDLSDYNVGDVVTELPVGFERFTYGFNTEFTHTYNAENGETVALNSNDEKVLRVDLAAETDFTAAKPTNGNFNNDGKFTTYYSLQVAVPKAYLPYIETVNLKINKQSKAAICYSYGVTDGYAASKMTRIKQSTWGTDIIGAVVGNYTPESLFFVNNAFFYNYNTNAAGITWEGLEYTHIYLFFAASTPDGYLDIEEIGYTVTGTNGELESAANADYNKHYITGFEDSHGVVTENAISGNRAYELYTGNTGYKIHTFNFKDYNPFADATNAYGLSFWVNNPTDSDITLKTRVKGDTDYVGHNGLVTIVAHSKLKVKIDFDNIYIDTDPSEKGKNTAGEKVSLTAEKKAQLASISLISKQFGLTIHIDDMWFYTEEDIEIATEGEVAVNTQNVTGATVTEDGKVTFASDLATGSDITAVIKVPVGSLADVDTMTFNFDSDVAASIAVTMVGTNDDGVAAHWKQGYQNHTFKVAAGDASTDKLWDFDGVNKTNNHGVIHEGTGADNSVCRNCYPGFLAPENWGGSSGHANNPPSSAERASIDTILVRVFNNSGEATQAVTLNSITYTVRQYTITADTTENGTVAIENNTLYAGKTAAFVLTPYAGYTVKSLKVVKENGEEIALTNGDGFTAENLGSYYSFTVPSSNVTIKAEFSLVEALMPYTVTYEGDSAVLDFDIAIMNGKVYNEVEGLNYTLNNYGVVIYSAAAIEKYGVDVSELTYEYVAELKNEGHHLANFVCVLDSADLVKTEETPEKIKFTVEITNVSAQARRNVFTMASYATFADEGVADYLNICEKSLDMLFYGDELVETFTSTAGINYCEAMEAIHSVSYSDPIFDIATWQDIYNQGFDYIRLPVKLGSSLDDNGKLLEADMVKLDKVIDNILRTGFSLIVDLHGLANVSGNYTENVNKYYSVWEQLSERYKYLPLSVAFQFINEPNTQLTASDSNPDPLTNARLNEMQEELIDIVRAVEGNEDRILVVGTDNNGSWNVNNISADILNAGNIYIDVHYYNPTAFTSSGAHWKVDEKGEMLYPAGEKNYNPEAIVTRFAELGAFQTANPEIQIILGEFGAVKPDYDAKCNYYSDIVTACEENGIVWCLWEYGGSYSPYDENTGEWDAGLMAALGF